MLRYDRQTKPGLVALYNIRPGNGAGPFLQPRSPHGAHGLSIKHTNRQISLQCSDTVCWATGRHKKLGGGLLAVMIRLELCTLISPVDTTISITLSSNKIQNVDILVPDYPDFPGKWLLNDCCNRQQRQYAVYSRSVWELSSSLITSPWLAFSCRRWWHVIQSLIKPRWPFVHVTRLMSCTVTHTAITNSSSSSSSSSSAGRVTHVT